MNFQKKLIQLNKNTFKDIKLDTNDKILCEFSYNYSNIICFSFFANFLKHRLKSKLVSYSLNLKVDFKDKIIFFFKKILKLGIFGIYKSFKIDEFILVDTGNKYLDKSKDLFNKHYPKFKSKKDIVDFKIKGVEIGDLIYDTYLKEKLIATIDLNDNNFQNFFINTLKVYLYWSDYLDKNKIKSVVLSHTVYINAILLRIAIKRKIPCYQVNVHSIYFLNKKNKFAYVNFENYSKEFKKLSKKLKLVGLKKSRLRIKKRFSGKVGVDMHYSTKSAFHSVYYRRKILSNNKKTKVIILTHDFIDNPHPYTNKMLFADYYEWLEFLFKLSKKSDYEWYVKTHPDFHPLSEKIINKLLLKYKNIKKISPKVSSKQIISEKIDCVLTVHGTAGWEYAYFGIPVINASKCNPHSSYNFNFHAKSINNYKYLITNFNKIKLKLNFDKKKISEFYLMHNIVNNDSNWIIEDFEKMIKKIKGWQNRSNQNFVEYWLNNYNFSKKTLIDSYIKNFLEKKEYSIKNFNFLNK